MSRISSTLKVKCMDNLEVSDIINKYIMCTQKMSLLGNRILLSAIIEIPAENWHVIISFLPFQFISHQLLYRYILKWLRLIDQLLNGQSLSKGISYSSKSYFCDSLIVSYCAPIMNK